MDMLSAQVEDAVLDIYDLVYDQVVRSPSGSGRRQLLAIQDTVSVLAWGGLPLAERLRKQAQGEPRSQPAH